MIKIQEFPQTTLELKDGNVVITQTYFKISIPIWGAHVLINDMEALLNQDVQPRGTEIDFEEDDHVLPE
jgi:hypothetical protein